MVERRGPGRLVRPPGFQRYSCHSCGQCCRGLFEIRVTPEEQARIEAQGWADRPELDGLSLFREVGGATALNHRPDGACVFLDDDNHCRIHAEFGEETKPLPCRLYPFVFVPDGHQVRADVRFDCPSVAGNRGRELSEHFSDLKAMLPQAVPDLEIEQQVEVTNGQMVEWSVVRVLAEEAEAILTDISLTLTDRTVALANFAAACLVAPYDAVDKAQMVQFATSLRRSMVEGVVQEDAPPLAAPPRKLRALFRQLVASLGRADRIGERPQTWHRLQTALRMVAGRGHVPAIQPTFAAVPFKAIEQPWPPPDAEAAAALTRFYRIRMNGFGFFGHACGGRSFADGLSALVLTYPVILWYARLFAAGDGASAIGLDHAVRAIQVVDHRYGRMTQWEAANEARRQQILCELPNLLALIRWYGGVEETRPPS